MTEAEFMASEDPAEMLTWLMCGPAPGERKLRLFSCACRRQVPGLGWGMASDEWGFMEEHPDRPVIANGDPSKGTIPAIEHARLFLSEHLSPGSKPPPALAAAILRDIAGNPWRPVTLPWDRACPASCLYDDVPGRQTATPTCPECKTPWHCPWLTPTVVSLAQAAYDERGRKCGRCKGRRDGRYYPGTSCDTCKGGGTIDDGSLDSARLAVLSDALEEAGCDSEELLQHLRGWARSARGPDGYSLSCGPHYRGCWAIDTLLSKE